MKILELTRYEAEYFLNKNATVYCKYGRHGELTRMHKDDCAFELENSNIRFFIVKV